MIILLKNLLKLSIVKPTMFYRWECWAIDKKIEQMVSVTETSMLKDHETQKVLIWKNVVGFTFLLTLLNESLEV